MIETTSFSPGSSTTEPRPAYFQITSLVEDYFQRLGDRPEGMGWPNQADAVRRYDVMLEVVRNLRGNLDRPIRLLDLGCGTGHLLEHLKSTGRIDQFQYTGIDLSPQFISLAQTKHPEADFRLLDILQDSVTLENFDYAVINGVLTSKCQMTFDEMWSFVQRLLTTLFRHVHEGIALNTMSKHVDWEREDLFHLPLDTLAEFLCRNLTRHFVIRNDYGLYEFTTYIYHEKMG